MEGLHQRRVEDPGDFLDAIVLGHLEAVDEAFLPHPGVPNQGPIHEHDADPSYGGMGTVGHDLDVWHLVEVPLEEHGCHSVFE